MKSQTQNQIISIILLIGIISFFSIYSFSQATKTDPLSATVVKIDPTCASDNSGSINLFVANGTQPYSFLWSNGATTPTLQNIVAGSYSVLVTDADGNTLGGEFILTEPNQIQISGLITHVTSLNGSNGSINATIAGGVPSYSYTWNTTSGSGVQSGQLNQTNLSPGTYVLNVVDMNGCQVSKSFIVKNKITVQGTPPTATSRSSVLFPNPSSGQVNLITNQGIDHVEVYDLFGTKIKEINMDSDMKIDQQIQLEIGNYTVLFFDQNGNTTSEKLIIR